MPQLLDRAGGDDVAAGEDPHRVAEPLDEVELVAGEDDRHAPAALVEEGLGERVDADGVQAGERLVEDQHLGAADQGRGQLDALLVAQRASRPDPPPLTEAEPVHPLGGRPRGRAASRPCSRAK